MTGEKHPNLPAAPWFEAAVLAASTGGLKAISVVLAGLPADFPAGIVIAQHLDPQHPSMMVDILRTRTPLWVRQAASGEVIQPGQVWVAPAGSHLTLTPERRLVLEPTGQDRHASPSADRLFRSAAAAYREQVIGIVLTGSGADGAAGVRAIRGAGGVTIAQRPETCEADGMPKAAIATGMVDYVLALDTIAPALTELVRSGHLPPG